ncbi:MAG: hypothetical protein LBF23_03655, partial [Endomicrobium sp.]|nr:hypothetical protein [Endomicrobium sp.]
YRRLDYSQNWINQRIKSIEVCEALTDEWDKSGVKQDTEYAKNKFNLDEIIKANLSFDTLILCVGYKFDI